MLNTKIFTEGFFQLLVKWTAIGEDFVVPDFLQIGRELFQRGEVRLSDEDRFGHECIHKFRLATYHGIATLMPC